MRHDRSNQYQRRHAHGDGGLRIVDFFEDEVVASLDCRTEFLIKQADEPPRRGEQQDQPHVTFAKPCDVGK